MKQWSGKTEVGWQTYLASRRDVIVAKVDTRGLSLDTLYHTVRYQSGQFIIISIYIVYNLPSLLCKTEVFSKNCEFHKIS